MSSSGASGTGPSPTKGPSQKKATARAKAAAARAEQQKAEKRRRIVLMVVIGAIVVGILATIAIVVLQSQDDSDGKGTATGPSGTQDFGIVDGSETAPVRIDVYQDYMCPVCGQFHEQSGTVLAASAANGTSRVFYHTLSFLDRVSQGTEYSTRAANAASCAADAKVFPVYNDLLFVNQPEENTPGLDDDKLIDLGKEAGADTPEFATCVRDLTYGAWVSDVTENAFDAGVSGTPTVRIDGKVVEDLSPEGLQKAIDEAAAS